MVFENFDQLLTHACESNTRKRCAVIGAESKHSVEAVYEAEKLGLVAPILFGNEGAILRVLADSDMPLSAFEIVACASPEDSLQRAIGYVHAGKVDILMKGQIDTKVLMKGLLKAENNLRAGGIVHSVAFAEIETYHKLIACTDGAIVMDPSVEQKKAMIENTVSAMRKMGWDRPKVAVLAAVEKVNPAMQSTVDAHQLKQLYLEGGFEDCIVDGPLAFDLAINKEAAKLKGFQSEVAGDADVLLYPNLDAGNIALKTIIMTGHNKTGSLILGMKLPVIMTSRGATMENKLRGILLATVMA